MWLLAVLTCLAVYRATRLLVEDKITEKPRLAVYKWSCLRGVDRTDRQLVATRLSNIAGRLTPMPMLAYFVTCPWCTSIWLGGLVVIGETLLLPHVPYPALLWLTSSAVAGFVSSKEG